MIRFAQLLSFLLCFGGIYLSISSAKHEGWEITLGRFAYLFHGTILYAFILLNSLGVIEFTFWEFREWSAIHRVQFLLTEVGILFIKERIHGR